MASMTKGQGLRIFLGLVAVAVSVAAIGLWWADGAWENGAMPTHGVEKVLWLSGGGLLCILTAAWIGRRGR